jgi:hypothetical protein
MPTIRSDNDAVNRDGKTTQADPPPHAGRTDMLDRDLTALRGFLKSEDARTSPDGYAPGHEYGRCTAAVSDIIPADLAPDRIEAQAARLAPLDTVYSAVVMLAVYRCAYQQLHDVARREIEALRAANRKTEYAVIDDGLSWIEPEPMPMRESTLKRLIKED